MVLISVLRLDVGDGKAQLLINAHAKNTLLPVAMENLPLRERHKLKPSQHTDLREFLFCHQIR